MRINILLATVFLTLVSFDTQAQSTGVKAKLITKGFAMDTVLCLPEVKERDAYIRRKTNDKRHLVSMIYGEPDSQKPYYRVSVGEDNGMSFVTHFSFFVYVYGGRILYYDTINDTAIDLPSWRKSLRKK